jgi:hypothetical protein
MISSKELRLCKFAKEIETPKHNNPLNMQLEPLSQICGRQRIASHSELLDQQRKWLLL